MIEMPDWLTLTNVGKVLESNFTTSLLGALAGAWGGALAAQKIADRSKRRESLLQEGRNVNAAMSLLQSSLSAFLNIKEQQLQELHADYQRNRERVHAAHAEMQRTGRPPTEPVQLDIRMELIDEVRVRMERIEDALGKLTISGRPVAIVAALGRSLDTLNHCIRTYNHLLMTLRQMPNDFSAIQFIYGLRRESTRTVDNTFADVLGGCCSTTDDCIYFCWRLSEDLHHHGLEVRKAFLKTFRGPRLSVDRLIFDEPRQKGLIPALENYATWENNFYWRVPATDGRRLAKAAYAIRRAWRRFWRLPWSRKVHVRRH